MTAQEPQNSTTPETREHENKESEPGGQPRDEASNSPQAEQHPNDELVFMMGKFAAIIPTDRQYCKNHMWAQPAEAGVYRFGLSAYAVRLLQDVYFLDWEIDPQTPVRAKQRLGQIESSKAESELYSPISGTLQEFNQQLLDDPAAINVDKYGRGWLFTIAFDQSFPPNLLTPGGYLEHLAGSWEMAQKTIKGQLHD